jgi:hypothetical protein
MRNIPKRLDLLPGAAEVVPDEGEDAKPNGGQSIHVTSEVDSHIVQDRPFAEFTLSGRAGFFAPLRMTNEGPRMTAKGSE